MGDQHDRVHSQSLHEFRLLVSDGQLNFLRSWPFPAWWLASYVALQDPTRVPDMALLHLLISDLRLWPVREQLILFTFDWIYASSFKNVLLKNDILLPLLRLRGTAFRGYLWLVWLSCGRLPACSVWDDRRFTGHGGGQLESLGTTWLNENHACSFQPFDFHVCDSLLY